MPRKVHVQATINGREADFLCEPRQSLLEVLRDELRLTGSKEGCNNGNCGACNVILDGRLVNSCLVLAVEDHVARPAVTVVAALLGPCQAQLVAQHFQQALPRLAQEVGRAAVDRAVDVDLLAHVQLPLARSIAVCKARLTSTPTRCLR